MTPSALSAVLMAKGTVTVALPHPHDPAAFYQTRAGLHVYREFRDRIAQRAAPTQTASPVTLKRFVLGHDARDKDIEAELGPNHDVTKTEVCWIVAEMIGKQKNGEAGDLDNTGNPNLFYTPSRVVYVLWVAVDREWSVLTWWRVDRVWCAGSGLLSQLTLRTFARRRRA